LPAGDVELERPSFARGRRFHALLPILRVGEGDTLVRQRAKTVFALMTVPAMRYGPGRNQGALRAVGLLPSRTEKQRIAVVSIATHRIGSSK